MKFHLPLFSALILTALLPQTSSAQLFYDTNGATGGTSTSSTQNFSDSVWTTDPTGSIATGAFVNGSDVVFSANDGTNIGTGTQNVTVDVPGGVINSLTFNNGTVTLFGSGTPNPTIGSGGMIVNSTDGATTLDSSLGTVTVGASQSWNNNSTQALNVGSGITGSGVTLSFGGTGSGNVNLNGVVSGGMNLTQNSATSSLYLNNGGNSFTGTVSANGGVIVAASESALGNGGNVIDLSNGGTIGLDNTMGFNAWTNNIVLGTGGGSIAAGDPNGGGIDVVYGGTVTGGTALNIVEGDFLPSGGTPYDVSSINISNARLLSLNNGIYGNGTAPINVASGATLDFAAGATINNQVNLSSGSALENRSGGVVLTNVVMPTTGTVTVGADDVGGGFISITSGITLAGALTLDLNENHVSSPFNPDTPVFLGGTISGSSGLTLTLIPGVFNEGTVGISGNNTYSGTTTINNVTTQVSGNSAFGTSNVTLNSTLFTDSATVNLTGGTLSNPFTAGTGTSALNLLSGSGNQTISGPIELKSGASINLLNNSTSTLTVNDITVDGSSYIAVETATTGKITLNGTYTSVPGIASTISFGDNGNGSGNFEIGSSADFSNFQTNGFLAGDQTVNLSAGNLFIDNSTFIAGQVIGVNGNAGTNHTLEMVGSQTINAEIFSDMKHGPAAFGEFTINQSTSGESTIVGPISLDSTAVSLAAVSGGRLNISGDIGGSSPLGLFKSGAGTVILSSAKSYGLTSAGDSVSPGVTSTVAMDVQQGTLLITNATGSAFGSNSGTVQVESGATLGGTGISTQAVVVEAPGSILAPGDSGSDGGTASIGTLHLTGGITASSGVTLSFKLDGVANDKLDLGAGAFTLGGPITVDFTDLGVDSVLPGTDYILATGTGVWSDSGATFAFAPPDGLFLASYDFNTSTDTFDVEFKAAPEPSTYALLLGGLGLLIFCRRRQHRAQV